MVIVVSEKTRGSPLTSASLPTCGIDPRRKKYVADQITPTFPRRFEPIARHIGCATATACTASDLKLFKYTKIKRPLYPFRPRHALGANDARSLSHGQL